MQKPNNFDETKVSGSFVPIELGGHHMIIKQVKEMQSSTGRQMLVVLLDMAKNDKQAGYASNEFNNDIRPDKKWPHSCTKYVMVDDENGNCNRDFKAFVTSFETSNKCEAVWGDNFCAQFKNKKIGAVYGEVENTYNGKSTMRHEIRWFCSDDKVDSVPIPKPKMEKKSGVETTSNATSSSASNDGLPDFMQIPADADVDIPF